MTTVYQNIDASIFIVIKEEEFIMTLLESVTQVGDPLLYF